MIPMSRYVMTTFIDFKVNLFSDFYTYNCTIYTYIYVRNFLFEYENPYCSQPIGTKICVRHAQGKYGENSSDGPLETKVKPFDKEIAMLSGAYLRRDIGDTSSPLSFLFFFFFDF